MPFSVGSLQCGFNSVLSLSVDTNRWATFPDQAPADNARTDCPISHRFCHQGNLTGPEENAR